MPRKVNHSLDFAKCAGCWCVSAAALLPLMAAAAPSDKVYTLSSKPGELEGEVRGGYVYDPGEVDNTQQAYVIDLGYGVTPWWFSELFGQYKKLPDESGKFHNIGLENIVLLNTPGQHAIDVGLYLEYKVALDSGVPDRIEAGPMLQKRFGGGQANLNLVAGRDVGGGASSDVSYEYRTQWRQPLADGLDVGVQGFGEFDAHAPQNWGPAVFGKWDFGGEHLLGYDAALLAGIGGDSPDVILRWALEYEF
ncbi:hypothetical protein E4T66_10615 [Sinimarinibacterium sp. CAU 1509]|uniref:hypothetical protein n=1 Tax=Sinimarinibacterium sp. CAU 1509 TaxID=2562283 RepID=UPI0010AD41BB|nr:hypothetical protein [Sinimarinibacterium sp. CAU 1509]TJY61076.1 hypothetical protein E4T66_10615 [Sinimarinibacterium sp. CAU 1509]